MNHIEKNQDDDAFASLLANYDEALANGQPPTPDHDVLDAHLRKRLEEAQACLQLLESAWPRDTNTESKKPFTPLFGISFPTHIGRFELKREVGRGGQGVVFQAFDPLLRRHVALKIPRPEVLVTKEMRRRFKRESEIAAGLDHPNLIAIYEVGEDGPISYLVTAFCQGPTLTTWLRQQSKPLPPKNAAQLLLPLVEAVSYTHSQGVLHRDIKPSNIMIDQTPVGESGKVLLVPKLTDFGLARFSEGETQQTRTGTVLGTLFYMAPEQANGRVHAIGPHTDVYALGVVLYECLVGRPPFQDSNEASVLRRLLADDPIPLQYILQNIPDDLNTICMKCLEKQPQKRYSSAAALASDLRQYLAGEPIMARAVGKWEKAQKWMRRHPMITAMSTLMFLSLSVTLILVYQIGSLSSTSESYRQSGLQAAQQRDETAELALLGRQLKYADNIVRLADSWKTDFRNVHDWDQAATVQNDLCGFEWWFLRERSSCFRTFKAHQQFIDYVRFSKDGNWWVSQSREGSFKCWNSSTLALQSTNPFWVWGISDDKITKGGMRIVNHAANNQVIEIATGKIIAEWARRWELSEMTISPDGRLVAFAGPKPGAKQEVRIRNVESGKEISIIPLSPIDVFQLCFAPDSKTLAISFVKSPADGGCIELRDVATGKEKTPTLKGHTKTVYGLAFSPDGLSLASGSRDRTVKIWDVKTGRTRQSTQDLGRLVDVLTFSPDGQTLVAGLSSVNKNSPSGSVVSWNIDDLSQPLNVKEYSQSVHALAFDPVKQKLVIGFYDGQICLLDWLNEQGFKQLTNKMPCEAWSVAFTPDSKTLAVSYDDEAGKNQGTLKLWDVNSGRVTGNLHGHQSMVFSVISSPDGQTFASASYDSTVKLWNAQSGQLRATLKGHEADVRSVAWSQDGKLLATGGMEKFINVWDAKASALLFALTQNIKGVRRLCFFPDSSQLVVVYDHDLQFWNLDTRQCTRAIKEASEMMTLACSPDKNLVATGNNDGVVKLWNAHTNENAKIIIGHKGAVRALAFSPDGKTLASGGDDRTVRLWQVATGRELLVFKDMPEKVNDLTFSSDGQKLAAAIHDGSVRIWYAAKNAQE